MSYGIVPSQWHDLLDKVYGPSWRSIDQGTAIYLANALGASNGTALPDGNGGTFNPQQYLANQQPSQAVSSNPTSWTTLAGQQQSYNPADNSMSFGAAPDVQGMFKGLSWTPTTQKNATPQAFDISRWGGTYDDPNFDAAKVAANPAGFRLQQDAAGKNFWVPLNANIDQTEAEIGAAKGINAKENEYQRIAARAFSDPNTMAALSQDPWNLGFRDSVDAKFTQADVDRFQREYMTQLGAQPNSAQLIAAATGANHYIDAPKLTERANQFAQQSLTQPATAANNTFLAASGAAPQTQAPTQASQLFAQATQPRTQLEPQFLNAGPDNNPWPVFNFGLSNSQNAQDQSSSLDPMIPAPSPNRQLSASGYYSDYGYQPGAQPDANDQIVSRDLGSNGNGSGIGTANAGSTLANSISGGGSYGGLGGSSGGGGSYGGGLSLNAAPSAAGGGSGTQAKLTPRQEMTARGLARRDFNVRDSHMNNFMLGSAYGATMPSGAAWATPQPMGEAGISYSNIGRGAGMLGGVLTGAPLLSMIGGAIGAAADANVANNRFDSTYGIRPVSGLSAAADSATRLPFIGSLAGQSVQQQLLPISYSAPELSGGAYSMSTNLSPSTMQMPSFGPSDGSFNYNFADGGNVQEGEMNSDQFMQALYAMGGLARQQPRNFASGGLNSEHHRIEPWDRVNADADQLGYDPWSRYEAMPPVQRQSMAGGGLGSLEPGNNPDHYNMGTQVNGQGDGRSDEVPAMLSIDEYVIPADVVAAKGDGSSNAGAKWFADLVTSTRDEYRKKLGGLPPPKA
jgi:uncharacterized membrane protein YgcG